MDMAQEANVVVQECSNPGPSSHVQKKRKKTSDSSDSLMNVAIDTLKSIGKTSVDACPFGSMVSTELKTMDRENQIFAKKLINDALHLRNLKVLKGTHAITEIHHVD